MTNPSAATKLRKDIEGLRAIAILTVVLFHAKMPGFSGGYIGVDLFFVLSGYLISGLLLDERTRTGAIGFASFDARQGGHPARTRGGTVCITGVHRGREVAWRSSRRLVRCAHIPW